MGRGGACGYNNDATGENSGGEDEHGQWRDNDMGDEKRDEMEQRSMEVYVWYGMVWYVYMNMI